MQVLALHVILIVAAKIITIPVVKNQLYHLKARKRGAHSLQIEIPSSKKFAIERAEVLPANIWSTFETILLSELQNIEDTEDLDTFQLYNEIVNCSKSNFCTLPLDDEVVLRNKTTTQIASKLKHMHEHAIIWLVITIINCET